MAKITHHDIRRVFLTHRPSFALMPAAELLGMSFAELKREVADGAIVAVSTRLGQRISKEEMIATLMRLCPQSEIEEALGDDAAALLPEALRLVELRARVPRYQRDMLRYFAGRDDTTVDVVLSATLDGVASAHSEELAAAVPGFAEGFGWPDGLRVPARS
jgi:hypothetical protein